MPGSKVESEKSSKLFPQFKHTVHRNSYSTEFICFHWLLFLRFFFLESMQAGAVLLVLLKEQAVNSDREKHQHLLP